MYGAQAGLKDPDPVLGNENLQGSGAVLHCQGNPDAYDKITSFWLF